MTFGRSLIKLPQLTLFCVGLFIIVALFANATLPLHPDEAYYWLWSKQLDWSYYDHPPAIAYLLTAFSFFGDSPFAIRLTALCTYLLTVWYMRKITTAAWDEKIANYAVILFCFLPLGHVGSSITTIDSPLFACWAMCLFYGQRATESGKLLDYTLAGLALGGALLSKYTGILLVPVLGLLLLRRPSLFLSFKPWLSLLLAGIIFTPVIVWNAHFDWVSFAFQWEHGTGTDRALEPQSFLEFIGGYVFVVATPLLTLLSLFGCYYHRSRFTNAAQAVLMFNLLVVLLFFGWKSLFEKMEINWYGPAVLGAVPYAAFSIIKLGYRKLGIASLIVMGMIVLILRTPEWLRLPKKINPQVRVVDYRPVIVRFAELWNQKDLLCSNVWSLAAISEYHLKTEHYSVQKIEKNSANKKDAVLFHVLKGRISNFEFWHQGFDYQEKNCLMISNEKISTDKQLCQELTLLETHRAIKGNGDALPLFFYRCKNINIRKRSLPK